MTNEWIRCRKSFLCPICESDSWCSVSADGSVAKCMRVAEGSFKSQQDGSGQANFHRLGNEPTRPIPKRIPKPDRTQRIPQAKIYEMAVRYREQRDLMDLAKLIGVSATSLARLWAGWDGQAWTFPMRDVNRRIIGIRRRYENGKKLTTRGTANGLFWPESLEITDNLFVTEGPTDTAALLDLGAPVIGRFSCSGNVEQFRQICDRTRPNVVIIADYDTIKKSGARPGQDGALALGLALKPVTRSVKIIHCGMHKDIRAWYQDGLTAEILERKIRNTGYL